MNDPEGVGLCKGLDLMELGKKILETEKGFKKMAQKNADRKAKLVAFLS